MKASQGNKKIQARCVCEKERKKETGKTERGKKGGDVQPPATRTNENNANEISNVRKYIATY